MIKIKINVSSNFLKIIFYTLNKIIVKCVILKKCFIPINYGRDQFELEKIAISRLTLIIPPNGEPNVVEKRR